MSVIRRILLAGLIFAACSLGAQAGTAGESIAKADRYWADNKLDDAQRAFEAAVKAEPDSVSIRLRLAGFQLSRQQTSDCIDNYHKVISQEPKNSKAWIGLGMAYLHSGRPTLARAAFEEAVRVDPGRKETLGPLLTKLNEKEG